MTCIHTSHLRLIHSIMATSIIEPRRHLIGRGR
jgi:hypothetical protein